MRRPSRQEPRRNRELVAIVLLFGLVLGCRPHRVPASPRPIVDHRRCVEVERANLVEPRLAGRGEPRGLSPREAHVARILGIDGLFAELEAARSREDYAADDPVMVALRHEIGAIIQQAALEVSAVSAELDCEEERADQLATALGQRSAGFELRLTIAAIGVGALAAIAAGVLALYDREVAAAGIGIGGGLLEGALGGAALMRTSVQRIEHPRNHLREMALGPEQSALFPPLVWRYLTTREPEGETTPRALYLERLKSVVPNEDRQRLLLGDGGDYDAETLRLRAALLDQLEADIGLMLREFPSLFRKVAMEPSRSGLP